MNNKLIVAISGASGFQLGFELLKSLKEKGIGASVHFDPPVHQQEYYVKRHGMISLPVTEKLAQEIVTLPMYPDLTKEQLDYMINTILEVIQKCRK